VNADATPYRKRRRSAALLALWCAGVTLQVSAVRAEEAPSPLDLNASLRADAWSGTRRLDDAGTVARASVWGRARLELGQGGHFVADGWLAAQSGPHVGTSAARVREAYWHGRAGTWDWKLGRQIVVWGRADGLNPTDNLSPRDFTLLVPVDNEQRRGNDGAQVSVDTGAGVLSALWFPRAASHTLPLPAEPLVSYRVEAAPHRPQWALKFDLTGDGIDGSLSWFQGTDPTPDVVLAGVGTAGMQVAVRNQPLQVLGADVSLTRDGVVWRAEAAWMRTASTGPTDFAHKKPRLWLVAGGEFPLGAHATLGLQASLQHVPDFRSPDSLASPFEREVAWRQSALANQTSATQAGIVWRLAGRWLNDTLTAETNGVWSGSPGTALLRTRLAYAVNDRVQVQAGTDHYVGAAHSVWGQFRKNTLAFVQVRVSL